jgi:hypothetical protein
LVEKRLGSVEGSGLLKHSSIIPMSSTPTKITGQTPPKRSSANDAARIPTVPIRLAGPAGKNTAESVVAR